MKKLNVKNLSNKEPTKDISLDDLKYKIPLSTSKKKIEVKISKDIVFGSKNIPVIAGPNGVESSRLMHDVAKILVRNKINIIRGHSYKPLTFPYRSRNYSETKESGMSIMDEIKDEARDAIVGFFEKNTHGIVQEVFEGTNSDEIPNWMLFTYIENDICTYHLHPMQEVVDFYTGNADVSITKGGNLNIGKITLQRKGGTGNPFDMQFKFRPLTFLENNNG